MNELEPGQAFREAWIAGVRAPFPGEPEPGYVAPSDQTPHWERAAAAAVETQIRQVATVGAEKLSPEQRGRFVALCWTAQIYQQIPEPKASYVAGWDALPSGSRPPTSTSSLGSLVT